MTCCDGVSDWSTSAPTLRSRTLATKSLTTLKLTSASSRDMRTSRIAWSTSFSVRAPFDPREEKMEVRRSVRLSNKGFGSDLPGFGLLEQCVHEGEVIEGSDIGRLLA